MTRLIIAFLTFITSIFAITIWSTRIGRKVWSPDVFAWRNPFKPHPIIEEQKNCPIQLVSPRFYSFMSIGSSIGSTLKLDVKNLGDKPIHSFNISYHSPEPVDKGSMGVQPETLLRSGQAHVIGLSSRSNDKIVFSVDFIQFADGSVWFADPPRDTVKPEGITAGAQAAVEYLRKVLFSDGANAVINVLPFIYSKVGFSDLSMNETFGSIGFYCGITNVVMRVENAFQKDDLLGVEKFLVSQY